MYIEPNTEIRILKNVPLDISYTNTLWFNTVEAQRGYFTNLRKYNMLKHTYQRVTANRMRIQIKYENLYDCNYLMFQNTAFGDKWFYAFITNVVYINDVTSEIEYQIDVLQTWLFDYEINQCYVIREHSVTDNVGDNIIDEGLDVGPIMTIDTEIIDDLNDLSIVLCCTHNVTGDVVPGYIWNDVYTGFNYFVQPATEEGVNNINALIDNIVENHGADGIVGCVMCPTKIAVLDNVKWSYKINKNYGILGTIDKPYTDIKNKKLMTYPYNYLQVTNAQGQSIDYKYELFDSSSIEMDFQYMGTCDLSPTIYLYPHSKYKGKADNYNEGISIANYPQCATTADTFKAWMAQNRQRLRASYSSSIIHSGMGAVKSAMTSFVPGSSITNTIKATNQVAGQLTTVAGATPNMMGAGMQATAGGRNTISYSTREGRGGYTTGAREASYVGNLVDIGLAVWDLMATVKDMETLPPTYHGTQNGSINILLDRQTFTFEKKTITRDYAQRIDDFFSRFGYATKKLKVPNRNSRPHWNYVKTSGCTLKGSIPKDDERVICAIHDNGVTYWKHGNEVGDYSLDNSPT